MHCHQIRIWCGTSLQRPWLQPASAFVANPIRRYVSSSPHISDGNGISSNGDSSIKFDMLIAPPATAEVITQRVLTYLDVKRLDAATHSLPLGKKTIHSPAFVQKLSSLLRWSFQKYSQPTTTQEQRAHVETLMTSLSQWTNMAKGNMWKQFYLRQFMFSAAPLDAYLALFDQHRQRLETASTNTEPADDEGNRNNYTKAVMLPSLLLLKEFCWRGRFKEAVDAYTRLSLTDDERKEAVEVLMHLEQFETVVQLYQVHRSLRRPRPASLDPFPLLNALAKLNRSEALQRAFQKLPPVEQSRPEIQRLVGNEV